MRFHQKVVLPMYIGIPDYYLLLNNLNLNASLAVTKHHDEGNVKEKAFIWTSDFRRLESTMAEQKHGDRDGLAFTSGSISRRQRKCTGDDGWF